MFKLLKLAFYVLVGYMLYELYQGLSSESAGRSRRPGSRQNITGPGRGTAVETEDVFGASATHNVGRGVV